MRVVTRFGAGEADLIKRMQIPVRLDKATAAKGVKKLVLSPNEVWPLTNTATLSFINTGSGIISNCKFWSLRTEAANFVLSPSAPRNETRLLLELDRGGLIIPLGFEEQPRENLIIRSWLDKWGFAHITYYENETAACAAFKEDFASCGTAGGIMVTLQLDMSERHIVQYLLLAETTDGVALHKVFDKSE